MFHTVESMPHLLYPKLYQFQHKLQTRDEDTYWGVAPMPFICTCASTTVHVTRFGTDADMGLSLKSSTETVISSVYHEHVSAKQNCVKWSTK